MIVRSRAQTSDLLLTHRQCDRWLNGRRRRRGPGARSGKTASVQTKNRLESRFEGLQLGAVQSSGELPEARLRIDHGQLFGHHAGLGAVDLDLRTKGCWSASGRGGCDETGGQRKVVRLDYDGVTPPYLFMSTNVLRCPKPVEVTTHGWRPSRRPALARRQHRRGRCAGPRPRLAGAPGAGCARPAG